VSERQPAVRKYLVAEFEIENVASFNQGNGKLIALISDSG